MSDRKIKLYIMYETVHSAEDAIKFLGIQDLPFAENIVWDEENPDYIVATDKTYIIPEYAEKFKKLAYRENENGLKPIRIFFTGEAISPDFNIFDYGIGWNWNYSYMDRASRRPAYFSLVKRYFEEISTDDARRILGDRKRFCNFLYSNGNANPMRDKLFHTLSEYKHVDSLGAHINNVGTLITQMGGGGIRECI